MNITNPKKIIALILAAALIGGILISCGNADNPDKNTAAVQDNENGNAQNPGNTVETPEAEAKILPDLPEEMNVDGYTFTFLAHREETNDWLEPDPRELIAEVENSETINDAVYKRNMALKEKYNIDFKMVSNTDEKSLLSKSVKAGNDEYDAVVIFNNNVPGTITGGLLTNIANLPYIDLDKPWWDSAVNSMSIDNKNYLLAGDLLILDNEATNALLFNKDLAKTLGMELPYNLVREGKWTMDAMNEMVKGASFDLNGDGKMTTDEDRWGFVSFNDTLHALLVSGRGALAVKDENDMPYMAFASPRNLAVIEKSMDIMYNQQDALNVQAVLNGQTSEIVYAAYYNSFQENRSLFMWARMVVIAKFRGMEAEFGIIPLPKFDENQDKYYSLVNPYTGVMLGVPKTAQNLERTSIILEALAAESRYTLKPAYYDVVLQRKFARDEESSEMLDIIFGSRVYDIGGVYSFGNVFMDFIALCTKSDRNVASYYDKKISAMEKAIEKVVAVFQDME